MTEENQEVKPKITEEQALEKFKMLYNIQYDLEIDIKEIVEECKEADLDGALIKSIAKAVVYGKLTDLVDKYNITLKKIVDLT